MAVAPPLLRPATAQSVLFVCSMNTVRSPMAAALLTYLHGPRLYTRSAGVKAGETDGFVSAIMGELGLDLARHHPLSIEELEDMSFDVIVTLSPEAHHRVLDLTRTLAAEVEYWPAEDPTAVEGSRAAKLDAYRALRDRLLRRIRERFPLPPKHGG